MKYLITLTISLLAGIFFQANAQKTFPYPSIPTILQTPEARGAYLLEHYWDHFNFQDTTLIHQPDITEQGFANFLDLLPRIDSTATTKGIEVFVTKVFGDSHAGTGTPASNDRQVPSNVRAYFSNEIEHYLYNPNSPMRSDALYLLFLREMQKAPAFDAATKERFAFQSKNVSKNLPGTKATDFVYTDRKGHKRTLYTTPGEYTVLYFNDPDCENCHATTAQFVKNPLLTNNSHLTFLAIYPDVDTEEWKRHPQPFPATWIDAYSLNGEISSKLLYFIRATPTLYLLDKDKRVILKDPTPEQLLSYIEKLNK